MKLLKASISDSILSRLPSLTPCQFIPILIINNIAAKTLQTMRSRSFLD
jgi:hypothetical protein